eukprot:TRINITY_DN2456_c0_g1_i2.p1 TRINITY_DN2456_c0_g1~~TRINITY_DN2456_c0_g1_i2.p1  ORF type:complete len:243 (-),score=51.90 TRINITY_DN2456_c0_g1_i2:10-738(-)
MKKVPFFKRSIVGESKDELVGGETGKVSKSEANVADEPLCFIIPEFKDDSIKNFYCSVSTTDVIGKGRQGTVYDAVFQDPVQRILREELRMDEYCVKVEEPVSRIDTIKSSTEANLHLVALSGCRRPAGRIPRDISLPFAIQTQHKILMPKVPKSVSLKALIDTPSWRSWLASLTPNAYRRVFWKAVSVLSSPINFLHDNRIVCVDVKPDGYAVSFVKDLVSLVDMSSALLRNTKASTRIVS